MKLNTNKTALIIAVLVSTSVLGACSASRAIERTNGSGAGVGVDPIYRYSGGLALKGYDPVAYFNEGKPVAGSDVFTHEWNGATWHFANEANRDSFVRQPEMYAPQYGGYCAWAVGHGYTAKGDPEAWKIVDGKLYLNYSQDVKAKWEQDIPGYIGKADQNWPRFLKEKPEHKGE
jgi:YHS domain-containing protein